MSVLRYGFEVEYVDRVTRIVCRATPFWVRDDGYQAFAIPECERPLSNRRAWKPFDHQAPDRLRQLFNFGPVSQEQMDALLVPEAPVFFFHMLSGRTRSRAKFGNIAPYGQMGSYFEYGGERRPNWLLSHNHEATARLPPVYRARWAEAMKHGKGWD